MSRILHRPKLRNHLITRRKVYRLKKRDSRIERKLILRIDVRIGVEKRPCPLFLLFLP